LSHPETAAVPPGDQNLFRKALGLAGSNTPLKKKEIMTIKEAGEKETPLFSWKG
jgi:hypothetical protein